MSECYSCTNYTNKADVESCSKELDDVDDWIYVHEPCAYFKEKDNK